MEIEVVVPVPPVELGSRAILHGVLLILGRWMAQGAVVTVRACHPEGICSHVVHGIRLTPVDFNFDSNCYSPYITAPSSPQRFGNFLFNALTSPTYASTFYHNLNDDLPRHSSASSTVPFVWEEKPGILKSKATNNEDDNDGKEDFEFNFSGHLERTPLTAKELFDCGKICALKPLPWLQSSDGHNSPMSNLSSPRSRISQGKKFV